MLPALGQSFRELASGDVAAATGSDWYDQANRALRPRLCSKISCRYDETDHETRGQDTGSQSQHAHGIPSAQNREAANCHRSALRRGKSRSRKLAARD
jgi:hypothetical protein